MNGRTLTLGIVAGLAVAGLARSRGSRSVPLVVPVDLETLKAIYLSWRDGSGGFEKDACVFRVNGAPCCPSGKCLWRSATTVHGMIYWGATEGRKSLES